MFKFNNKIKEFLIGNRRYYIFSLIVINLISYLFNLMSYQTLTEEVIYNIFSSQNVNGIFILFFIKMLIGHFIEFGTQFLLERQIIHIIRGIFKNIITRVMYYKINYFKKNSNSKINQLWFYLSSVESLIEQIILKVPKIVIFLSKPFNNLS